MLFLRFSGTPCNNIMGNRWPTTSRYSPGQTESIMLEAQSNRWPRREERRASWRVVSARTAFAGGYSILIRTVCRWRNPLREAFIPCIVSTPVRPPVTHKGGRRSLVGPHFFLLLAVPRPCFDLPAVHLIKGGIGFFFPLPFSFPGASQHGSKGVHSGIGAHHQQFCHQGVGGANLALQ